MIAIREKCSFPLGELRMTRGAEGLLQEAGLDFAPFLERHASGDWGEVDAADWEANDEALNAERRLLSAYGVADGQKIWIITESDRSATTFLLPEEY